jgi:hypothetical protein
MDGTRVVWQGAFISPASLLTLTVEKITPYETWSIVTVLSYPFSCFLRATCHFCRCCILYGWWGCQILWKAGRLCLKFEIAGFYYVYYFFIWCLVSLFRRIAGMLGDHRWEGAECVVN